MEKQKTITPDMVEKYLNDHPTFIEEWLSKSKARSTLDDKYVRKTPRFSSYVEKVMMKQKREKRQLISSLVSENELFSELVKDITHEINVNDLSHKILQNIIKLTHCERGSLFFIETIARQKFLVSNLFDVTSTSAVTETLRQNENVIRIPVGKGIAGYVAETKQKVNIVDAYEDSRFNKEIDEMTGCRTKCLLCMPILNYCDEVIGVAQIINKLDGEYFTENDEKTFNDYLYFCGISLNNAQLFAKSVEEYKRNQQLLNLVGDICAEYSNFMSLIEVILSRATEILDCSYVCLGLLTPTKKDDTADKELNLYEMKDDKLQTNTTNPIYRRVAMDFLQNKDRLFMYNVKKDSIFGEEDSLILNTNCIGAIALLDTSEEKNGCIFFTKDSTEFFNESNFTTMETFGLFCGLGIHNCQICWSTIRCLAQQQISHEILSFHTTADEREVNRFLLMDKRPASDYGIYTFSFNDLYYSDDTTVIIVAFIFLEMNALQLLDIEMQLLYKWILTVRKNYRPVIYHNWRHGVNVTQSFFCMLTTGGMKKYFSDFEMVVILVACLCHDLDHRGTNNDYEVKTASKLATIYSSSTLEHHHFDHCIMILNNEKTNIFQNIPVSDYKNAVHLIEKAILSTDLSYYFQNKTRFEELVTVKENFEDPERRDLLLAMMITGADLSAITKPWSIQKKVALLVAAEFFELGDLQKNVLKSEVIAMLDREKRCEVPRLQVCFIDFVCKTVFESLEAINKNLKPLLQGCMNNRRHWQNIVDGKEEFDIDIELNKTLAGFLDSDDPEYGEGSENASQITSGMNSQITEDVEPTTSLTGGFMKQYERFNDSKESSEILGSLDFDQSEYNSYLSSPSTSGMLSVVSVDESKDMKSMSGDERRELEGTRIDVEGEDVCRIMGNKMNKKHITGGQDISTKLHYIQPIDPIFMRKKTRKTCLDEIVEDRKLEMEKKKINLEPIREKEVSQKIRRASYHVIPPHTELNKSISLVKCQSDTLCRESVPEDSFVCEVKSAEQMEIFRERKRRCLQKSKTDSENEQIEKSVVCVIA
uniref:Phosphodiesterase n=1 Tax=Octopus bimaculoides TaxID=37653 RepID=A0A0L8HM88_OCTBM